MCLTNIILGINIIRNSENLVLTQSHYIKKILIKFEHYNCKLVPTPFDSNIKLYSDTGKAM